MRADLHVHSSASDGTEPPAEVMRRAAQAGLDVVALTDHDTVAGHAEARQALADSLTLLPGMELSGKLGGPSRGVPGGFRGRPPVASTVGGCQGGRPPVASTVGGCQGGRPPVASTVGGCQGGRPPVASRACTCWLTFSTPNTQTWPPNSAASGTTACCAPRPWCAPARGPRRRHQLGPGGRHRRPGRSRPPAHRARDGGQRRHRLSSRGLHP